MSESSACSNLMLGPLSILGLASPAFPGVLIVDAGGGGDHIEIQAAIDAAQPGDTLLVEAGVYSGFVVDAKPLAIVAELGALVKVLGGCRVQELDVGDALVLTNLHVRATGPSGSDAANGLVLRSNRGHVWIAGCDIAGRTEPFYCCSQGLSNSGILSASSAGVVLAGCTVAGGSSAATQVYAGSGGDGLITQASRIAFFECRVSGGDGKAGDVCYVNGGSGGDGGRAYASLLYAALSSFQGGDGGRSGGMGSQFGCVYGGDGGDGLSLLSSIALLLETGTGAGSPGGIGPSTCGPCGFKGEAGLARYGTGFVDHEGKARAFAASSPVRESTTATFVARGQPGDHVYVLSADSPALGDYREDWNGWLVVDPAAATTIDLGTLPASGELQIQIAVQALAPGESAHTFFLQSLFLDAQNRPHLGTPASLVVLDSSY